MSRNEWVMSFIVWHDSPENYNYNAQCNSRAQRQMSFHNNKTVSFQKRPVLRQKSLIFFQKSPIVGHERKERNTERHEGQRDRETERERERRTQRETERQIEREREMLYIYIYMYVLYIWIYQRDKDRETERQWEKQKERETDRKKESERARERERERDAIYIYVYIYVHVYLYIYNTYIHMYVYIHIYFSYLYYTCIYIYVHMWRDSPQVQAHCICVQGSLFICVTWLLHVTSRSSCTWHDSCKWCDVTGLKRMTCPNRMCDIELCMKHDHMKRYMWHDDMTHPYMCHDPHLRIWRILNFIYLNRWSNFSTSFLPHSVEKMLMRLGLHCLFCSISFSNSNLTSLFSLGLFCHIPLKRD